MEEKKELEGCDVVTDVGRQRKSQRIQSAKYTMGYRLKWPATCGMLRKKGLVRNYMNGVGCDATLQRIAVEYTF